MARPKKLPTGMVTRPDREGYFCDFCAGEKRIRRFLSTSFEAAKTILNQLKARYDLADHGILDNDCPIAELRTKYMRAVEQNNKPGTVTRYTASLDHILPAIGATKVAHIDVDGIMTYRQQRLEAGISPRTINHDVTVLSAMLNWGAAKSQRLIGSNPVKGLDKLRHDRPKDGRPFTPDEFAKLLGKSPQLWRDIWYALAVTGMRSGELSGLTFDDVDWENRELIVRAERSKNRTGRRVPIEDGLYAILETRLAGREQREPGKGRTPKIHALVQARFTRDHIFTTSQNTPLRHRSCLWRALQHCCKLGGIETHRLDADGREIDHVDVHSFRRTFATDAIAQGADLKSVQEIGGWKTLSILMDIYARTHRATKRQAVAKLSYGQGAVAPAHVVEYPETLRVSRPVCHQSVTKPAAVEAQSA